MAPGVSANGRESESVVWLWFLPSVVRAQRCLLSVGFVLEGQKRQLLKKEQEWLLTRTHPAAPRPWETWGSCASPPGGTGVSAHCHTKATDTKRSVREAVTATPTDAGSPACWANTQPHAPFPSNTHGRERRGAEEPLDDSERGEGKSWLKAQHSEN